MVCDFSFFFFSSFLLSFVLASDKPEGKSDCCNWFSVWWKCVCGVGNGGVVAVAALYNSSINVYDACRFSSLPLLQPRMMFIRLNFAPVAH